MYRFRTLDRKGAAFKAALFFVTAFACAYLSLFFIVKSAWFQHWLKAKIAQRSGYDISVDSLSLSPPLQLVASTVTISKSSKILLQSDRLVLSLSPTDLFYKTIHRLRLHKPILNLDLRDAFGSPPGTAVDLPVRRLNIEDGVVVLQIGEMHELELRSVNLDARNLNLEESDGLNLRADVPWLKSTAEISLRNRGNDVEAALRLQQHDRSRLRLLKDESHLPLRADVKFHKDENEFVKVTATGRATDLRIGAQKITGNFESELRLLPGGPNADLSAQVTLSDFPSRLAVLPFSLPRGTASAKLNGQYSFARKVFELRNLQLTSALGNAQGSGQIVFNPEPTLLDTQVRLRNVPVEHFRSLLPQPAGNWNYAGRVDADLELQGPFSSLEIEGIASAAGLQLRGDHFSLADLTLKVPLQWVKSSFLARDVQLHGKKLAINETGRTKIAADEIRFAGGFAGKKNEPFKILGTLQLLGGRFATPDGAKVGENLLLSARFGAAANWTQGSASATGSLVLERGELLWGKFFTDLRAQKPAFDFDGNYSNKHDIIRFRRLTLALAHIGAIDLIGSIEQLRANRLLSLDVKGHDLQTRPVFELFRETLNRSYPFLNQLTMTGGLGFSFKARGNVDKVAAEGRLELRKADIRTKSEHLRFGPIDFELPFRVQIPGASEIAPANLPIGNLAIAGGRIGTEPVGAISSSVSFWNNQLQFHQPIIIPIYGGAIELSKMGWRDLIRDPRAFSASIRAKDLQLQRLAENLGWYRFGGTLTGSIPQVESTEDSLRSQGDIRINVFGGRIRMDAMEIQGLFSAIPSIKLNASFQNIHLDQASETFAFGRVSGILEGRVNDLVITAGQPSQFRADVHTVDKPGSSQWISVEALNKITVLSSGSEAGALYGGLGGLFDNFRYSKLGFKATLRNDKLTLRGIESKDGKEYLVVGSWFPPSVNIISHTQEIGFSELIRRLERIKQPEQPEPQ